MRESTHRKSSNTNIYFRVFGRIVVILSFFLYVLHLFLLDFQNVLLNIAGLDLSDIDNFFLFSGQIVLIIILLIILGLSLVFLFVKNTYLKSWKKIVYYISLGSFLSFLIISIISSYDIAKIFFEANPIDIINHYPSDTPTYLFRAFMIFLFIIAIGLLNLGLSIFIHKFIIPIKTENSLLFLLLILGMFINILPAIILFNII